MPRVTQAHRDARRRQILDAARVVFAEKGFAQASTGDIITATGLSTGAVYSYFPSKNDLVLAVCHDAVDALIDAASVRDLGGLLTRIRALNADNGHARLIAQVWGEAAVSEELAGRVREQLEVIRTKVAALVVIEREARGLDADPAASGLAEALLATLTGYNLRLAIGQDIDLDTAERALHAIVGTPPATAR